MLAPTLLHVWWARLNEQLQKRVRLTKKLILFMGIWIVHTRHRYSQFCAVKAISKYVSFYSFIYFVHISRQPRSVTESTVTLLLLLGFCTKLLLPAPPSSRVMLCICSLVFQANAKPGTVSSRRLGKPSYQDSGVRTEIALRIISKHFSVTDIAFGKLNY